MNDPNPFAVVAPFNLLMYGKMPLSKAKYGTKKPNDDKSTKTILKNAFTSSTSL